MGVLAEALTEQGKSFEDIAVAVQGFGNVGSNAARLIAERGAKIVAVADHTGGVCAETGLDIPALVAWVAEHGGVKGFPSGEAFVLAIRRVGKAALARVHIKTKLPF